MAVSKEIQVRKEADIKAAIKRLLAERKYTVSYIMDKVAHDFYLTPTTVSRIYWGEYDARRARLAEQAVNVQDEQGLIPEVVAANLNGF